MSVIEFPTADRPITKSEIDKPPPVMSADEAAEIYNMLPDEDRAAVTAMVDQFTKSETDKRHAEAFRNLENEICKCTNMARIAAQMVLAEDDGTNPELVFAVCHVSEMLDAFKANYYAAWDGGGTGAH